MRAEAQWRVAWQQMACSGEGEGHTRLLEKLRVECRSQPPPQIAHFTCGCGSVGGQPSVRAAGSENRVRNQGDEAGWQVCTRPLDQHVHRTASGPGWWRVRARAEAKGAPKALLTQYGQTIAPRQVCLRPEHRKLRSAYDALHILGTQCDGSDL